MAALLDGAAPAAAAAEAGFGGCAVVGDLGCDLVDDLEIAVAIAAGSRGESGECKSGDGDGC